MGKPRVQFGLMFGVPGRFCRRLLDWYAGHRRDLPWRSDGDALPEAYRVLVSEVMLQQTQVATVMPYFNRFMDNFPNVLALAGSDEQEVLRLWQGLGYYSRARNLRRAAREIVDRFGGQVPDNVEQLRSLPGIGRYTAGAIASIAHGRCEPIVDGNVARVICRLDLIRADSRNPRIMEILWKRAGELVPDRRPGDFNSAMMELGATICMPRNPDCAHCPVRLHCRAKAAGMQEKIPKVRKAGPVRLEKRATLCIESNGRWLIEQRPATGRWGALWQFTTFVSPLRLPGVNLAAIEKLGMIRHALTHRRYEFTAYRCRNGIVIPPASNRKWVRPGELDQYPMSKPQRQIARLLGLD
jgi:A/G-specific adenine glycosylase